MKTEYWEHYSHPADMGIRGIGNTKEKAFSQAALALTAVITNPENIEPAEGIEIECEEIDDEQLLFVWLNALLYEMDSRNMLFSKFEIVLKDKKLHAEIWGEQIDPKKHKPVVEVKAATYADLKVQHSKNGLWIAQCIVDV
ncbi:MAG: archease [Planctomycetota bacterium]|jgi:tRNA nucleotidyltransferase (CCA-adding enzyme)